MNNAKRRKTIKKRQVAEKEVLLEQLRKYPIVLVACEKAGVARPTCYRWRDKDKKFAEAVEKAMDEGEDFFNDLSEHQLLSLMKDKHWGAIRYWLEKRHPKFNTTKIAIDQPIEVAFTYHQKQ